MSGQQIFEGEREKPSSRAAPKIIIVARSCTVAA